MVHLNLNGAFTLTFINIAVDVSIISYDIQILLSAVFAGVDRMLLVFFIIFPLQGCCIQIVTQSQMSQPSTLLCPQRRTLTGYAKYVNSGTTWHTADQCMTRLWDVHRVHRCLSLVDCVNKNKYLAKAELGGRPIHSKFWTGWIYTEWSYFVPDPSFLD